MGSERAMTECRLVSLFSIQTGRRLGEELGINLNNKRRFRTNVFWISRPPSGSPRTASSGELCGSRGIARGLGGTALPISPHAPMPPCETPASCAAGVSAYVVIVSPAEGRTAEALRDWRGSAAQLTH